MIVGVDQALLDLVVQVDADPGIFERFDLERNTQCLAETHHAPLLDDLLARAEEGGTVRKTPGGVVANSLRAAAFMLRRADAGGTAGAAARRPELKFVGMVGSDPSAERLRQELSKAGVDPMFTMKPRGGTSQDPNSLSERTGVCCCLIAGKERTMVTELGAGKTMELHGNHGPEWPGWDARIRDAEAAVVSARGPGQAKLPIMVILSAFYAQADVEGAKAIQRWCQQPREDGGPRPLLALAISAEWCCRLPAIQDLARTADFLFANQPEIEELAASLRESGAFAQASASKESTMLPKSLSISECAITAVAQWKANGWVIATRGSRSVGFMRAGGEEALMVPVPRLPPEEFVDDVGAGDSFMGGFLGTAWLLFAERCAALASAPPKAPGSTSSGCFSGCWEALARQASGAAREPSLAASEAPAAKCLKTGQDEGLSKDPAGVLFTESDIEAACKAGIATAAVCLRSVGCQFPP